MQKALSRLFVLLSLAVLLISCTEKHAVPKKQALTHFLKKHAASLTKEEPNVTLLRTIHTQKTFDFCGIKYAVHSCVSKEDAILYAKELAHRCYTELCSFDETEFFVSKRTLNKKPLHFIFTFWTKEGDRPPAQCAAQVEISPGFIHCYHKEIGNEALDTTDVYTMRD